MIFICYNGFKVIAMVLKVEQLTKYYGKFKGINNVSFEVEKGKILGFIGPNGAGKSTTIRTILGLLKATSGHVELLDEVVDVENISTVLRHVGYMSSESQFYDNMKVRDIIKLSLELHDVKQTEYQQHLVKTFDVPIHKKFSELSFGNRKKVSIVCALQHQPKLLILDEPTNGLDPLMQILFFKEIKALNEQFKTTILLSSHHLKEIENYCDDFMFIRNGELISKAQINQLLHNTFIKVHINEKVTLPNDENIKIQSQSDIKTTLLYRGEMHALLKLLITLNVKDIEILKPDLEELFLTLYEVEGVK